MPPDYCHGDIKSNCDFDPEILFRNSYSKCVRHAYGHSKNFVGGGGGGGGGGAHSIFKLYSRS